VVPLVGQDFILLADFQSAFLTWALFCGSG